MVPFLFEWGMYSLNTFWIFSHLHMLNLAQIIDQFVCKRYQKTHTLLLVNIFLSVFDQPYSTSRFFLYEFLSCCTRNSSTLFSFWFRAIFFIVLPPGFRVSFTSRLVFDIRNLVTRLYLLFWIKKEPFL